LSRRISCSIIEPSHKTPYIVLLQTVTNSLTLYPTSSGSLLPYSYPSLTPDLRQSGLRAPGSRALPCSTPAELPDHSGRCRYLCNASPAQATRPIDQ
jgi:hypothetical protein